MGIAEIQKVEILAHSEIKQDILSCLQEEGVVQIESQDLEETGLVYTSPQLAPFEHDLHRLSHVLAYLSEWEKKSFKEKLMSRKPQVSTPDRKDILKSDYVSVLEKVERLEAKKSELQAEVRFLEREKEFLMPLTDLIIPVQDIQDTENTKVLPGHFPASKFDEFQKIADEEPVWFTIIHKGKRDVFILLIHAKDQPRLDQALKDLEFIPVFFTDVILSRAGINHHISHIREKLQEDIESKEREIEALDEEAKNLTHSRKDLMKVYDVLLNEREKLHSSRLIGETERVFYLEGWIRSADIQRLKAKLKPHSELIDFYFRPPQENEDPPVMLDNPKIWKPFEIITKLYGLPQRGSLDPTVFMAPFFFIFVGLTLSEAGYGFLIFLVSLLFLIFAKPKGGLRQFLILLSILGFANVIIGTMVGGWFGFPVRKLMVLDPLQDPVKFLLLSLALGFIQVWFGTLLNLVSGIKNKEFLRAIFVQGGWLLLLPSLVVYGITNHKAAGALALVGAAGIVFFAAPSRNPLSRFFGGLYSLYDISRYLADILSYSRLLALGLATSVIAMVVNTLCQTALGIPWIGWLIAALIFVGGHLFNLGIGMLGGFVHSMRLQFVEFFSKFFKSGGKPFKPFELESKYTEFIP